MEKSWRGTLAVLILFSALVFLALSSLPDSRLHLVFCDVGQGDAILLYRGTTQVLFDAGPDTSVLTCLGDHMPFWDRKIELALLTHPDADHITGIIQVLRRYQILSLASTGLWKDTEVASVAREELEEKKVKEIFVNSATKITVAGAKIDIVWPSYLDLADSGEDRSNHLQTLSAKSSFDWNAISVILLLRFGGFEAVLTGDASPGALTQTLKGGRIGKAEVLKVPHHGSRNGLTREFLAAVEPKIAVISVGKNNSYGHPHQEVLRMLQEAGVRVLRTDINGEVEVLTDGKTWWVR